MRPQFTTILALTAALALTHCGSNTGDHSCDGAASCADGAGAHGDGASGLDASGGDGGSTADGSAIGDGGSPCPSYQSLCGGRCIPTSVDPQNCGGCGVVCTGSQVCSGGACSSGCLPTLTACGHACVDTQSDNQNCGGCGQACAGGEGCVAGMCRPAVTVNPGGVDCTNGGPPIQIGGFMNGQTMCSGDIAEVAFRWALCSCQDVTMSDQLLTDGFDSSRGPYMPGGLGGGVGANNRFANSNTSDIWGALWTATPAGVGASSPQSVHQELHANGALQSSGSWTIGNDAFVNGNVTSSGTVAISGALHVPPGATVAASVTDAREVREPVVVPHPCDCNADQFLPIANIVEHYRTVNDDARIGLSPTALDQIHADTRLDLPCGSYFLTRIGGSQPITIVAHGHTALFVGGDVSMSAPLTITLDPTATLDVFLEGTVATSSPLAIGSPNYPALTRIYIASTNGFGVSNDVTLAGNFYVPNGLVHASSALEAYGAIFAGDFSASNRVSIHYDREVLRAGDDCNPSTPPDGGVSMPDAGSGCNSCRDCGNQACIDGMCGACRTSADCCAPLQCADGRCIVAPG